MDRLTPLDGSFLRVETPSAHMHVAWCGLFEPKPGRPRPSVAALRRQLASRLRHAPRFRQRLGFPPPGMGEPFWVDDPDFDISKHVTELTAPGEAVTETSFSALADALLSEPLDRNRPLWHLYLVPRLEDGRAGVICKLHHAMVDGVSVVEIGLLLFDAGEDQAAGEDGWEPPPPPGRARLALKAVTENAARSLEAARAAVGVALKPRRAASDALGLVRRSTAALSEDVLRLAPPAHMNAPIGPERTLVTYEQPIEPLLDLKERTGVTLNDACLAAVTGALRLMVAAQGESPRPLKTMVPVSIRAEDEAVAAGNRISFAFIDLPLHESSPELRVLGIHSQTAAFKESDRPAGFSAVLSGLGLLPSPLRGPAARLVGSPRMFNLVVSNIPGPREPVGMLGAELVEAYPVVPLADGHALSVGMFGYNGSMFFGLYADPHALPAVRDLPRHLRAGVAELESVGPPREQRESVLAPA